MLMRLIRALARGQALTLLLTTSAALAEDNDKEALAILQLGGAAEWGLNNGGSGSGPTAAVEFTPIKNWLEVETGVSTAFSKGQTEWDTDFIFKKPFDLSLTVEFEPEQWCSDFRSFLPEQYGGRFSRHGADPVLCKIQGDMTRKIRRTSAHPDSRKSRPDARSPC